MGATIRQRHVRAARLGRSARLCGRRRKSGPNEYSTGNSVDSATMEPDTPVAESPRKRVKVETLEGNGGGESEAPRGTSIEHEDAAEGTAVDSAASPSDADRQSILLSRIEAAKRLSQQSYHENIATTQQALAAEHAVYGRMVDLERQLDVHVARKLQDVTELAAAALTLAETKRQAPDGSLATNSVTKSRLLWGGGHWTRRPTVKRTLRLYVYNTYRGQGGEAETPPSWVLRVQGSLLHAPALPALALTAFFHRVVLEVDPDNVAGQQETFEWVASRDTARCSAQWANATPVRKSEEGPAAATAAAAASPSHPEAVRSTARATAGSPSTPSQWADGFEVQRQGQTPVEVRLFLFPAHLPPRYRLSAALAELLAVEEDTLGGALVTLWYYVKRHGLLHPEMRGVVMLDDKLRRVFGEPAVQAAQRWQPPGAPDEAAGGYELILLRLSQLCDLVRQHLAPLPPIEIRYRLQLSGIVQHDCYDIDVDVDAELLEGASAEAMATGSVALNTGTIGTGNAATAANVAAGPRPQTTPGTTATTTLYAAHPKVARWQAAADAALERLHCARLRRAFFGHFAESPVEFLRDLLVSHTRDRLLLQGKSGRFPEEERRSGLYHQQWVHEAVPRYLWRQLLKARKTPRRDSGNSSAAAAASPGAPSNITA